MILRNAGKNGERDTLPLLVRHLIMGKIAQIPRKRENIPKIPICNFFGAIFLQYGG